MRPHFTLEQYRGLDLFFFAAIAFFAELVITLAASRWYPDQLYTVSAGAALTAIVMIRWKGYAAIPALTGGLALCIAMGAVPVHYLIYCLGNLFGVAALLFLKAVGEKRIRENAIWTIGFGVCTLVLMQAGRALIALLLGYGIRNGIAFFATDSLSYVFTAVILWVARRQDGLFEDQKEYLVRLHTEMETEKEEIP